MQTPPSPILNLVGASLRDSENRVLATGQATLEWPEASGCFYPDAVYQNNAGIEWSKATILRGSGDHCYKLTQVEASLCDAKGSPAHLHFYFRWPVQ